MRNFDFKRYTSRPKKLLRASLNKGYMSIYGPSVKEEARLKRRSTNTVAVHCDLVHCKERRFPAKQTEQTTFHQYAE